MIGCLLFVANLKKYTVYVQIYKYTIFVQVITFISRKLYSFKELSLSKEIIFFQGNIFYQGNYIHLNSKKYIHSKKLYSFNNVAFPDRVEKFIQKVSPATL